LDKGDMTRDPEDADNFVRVDIVVAPNKLLADKDLVPEAVLGMVMVEGADE